MIFRYCLFHYFIAFEVVTGRAYFIDAFTVMPFIYSCDLFKTLINFKNFFVNKAIGISVGIKWTPRGKDAFVFFPLFVIVASAFCSLCLTI